MIDYELEKWIWTEKDFESMGWHDATVYGLRLDQNLTFDIDYIFKWNQPDVEGFHFTFWVAPSTLIFENPMDISFDLTQSFDDKWLEIEDLEMKRVDTQKNWTIMTQQGYISFNADTFRQIIRRNPTFQLGQSIPYDERGGFSFDLTSGEKVNQEVRPAILERRKRDFDAYEIAKRKFVNEKELEGLVQKHESGQMQTKDYMTTKKQLKEMINSLIFQLRGTRYEEV